MFKELRFPSILLVALLLCMILVTLHIKELAYKNFSDGQLSFFPTAAWRFASIGGIHPTYRTQYFSPQNKEISSLIQLDLINIRLPNKAVQLLLSFAAN